jgi:hypothetical protein
VCDTAKPFLLGGDTVANTLWINAAVLQQHDTGERCSAWQRQSGLRAPLLHNFDRPFINLGP